MEAKVTICILEDGAYTDRVFRDEAAIVSTTFPNLNLTAAQILQS
jgi:Uma2 family endonuclease